MSESDGSFWGRSRLMTEFREDVVKQYRLLHGGDIVQAVGFYYGTIEVNFATEGNSRDAAFTVHVTPGNPVVDSAFNLAIGDISTTWFSTSVPRLPHVVNDADTNLQNPGTNLFADEVFIIEAVSARLRGLRIGYSPSQIASMVPAPNGSILAALQGNQLVRDQAGLMVPKELFNQFDDTYRMAKTLEEMATLHFKWADNGIGGSGMTADVLVDSFLAITKDQRGVKQTSGGNAQVLDLPQGYIWCLDKMWMPNRNSGGNGIFDAELHLAESVTYPFKPTTIFGSPEPVAPIGTALYWVVRLYGTSLTPARSREFRPLLGRRTQR